MTTLPSDLPAGVSLEEGEGGLPVLRVRTDTALGEVYLHGAHVTRWQPAGSSEVLWMSKASQFATGSPVRGGIPVCFPWFGPGRDGEQSPGHGLVRLVPWRLVDAGQAGGGVRLTLEIDDEGVRDGLAQASPEVREKAAALQPFTLRYAVTFGAHLRIEVSVENRGSGEFSFEEALHTYYSVGHVGEVRVEGLGGAEYFDKVERRTDTQEGDLVLTGFTDRVYASDDQVTVQDAGLGRSIAIYAEQAGNTVVWNPWQDRADLADIHEGAWPGFLCVECANVGENAVTLAPGQTHTMTVRVDVETTR